MSFSVDLWNGFDIIKEKLSTTNKQIRQFNKLLTTYINIERDYCRNLENLYKEYKETEYEVDSPIEISRINIIKMLDFETQNRKEFINNITKNINEKITKYLSEPKILLENIFYKNTDLTTSFKKSLNKLTIKQEEFHSACKELSSNLSQNEIENNPNKKLDDSKIKKSYNKVIKVRDEYLFLINETNIERNNFNCRKEDLLNDLEKTYKKTIENFKSYLYDFSNERYKMLSITYLKEKTNFENCHSKINLEKEFNLFVMKNATKQFPMTKIEFCPLKLNSLTKFIKSKYQDNLKEKECSRIVKVIQEYFQNHNLFPDNLIQSGISKISRKKSNDLLSSRRLTMIIGNKANLEKNKEQTPEEKETIIMKNIKFIKNFINEIITNNKIKIFEDKINNQENIFKLDEGQDKTESMNTNEKINELMGLLDIFNESSSVYIETFIKTLSYIRSKGFFEINNDSYYLLQIAFIKILEQNPRNDYMLKNIIILSQTFYNIIDKEKIYLQKGLKGNNVLNRTETWHRCINYTINLANSDRDLTNQVSNNELIKKVEKEALNTVISYLCDMKHFVDNEKVYEKVKNYYIKVYKLDEKFVNDTVEEYMKDLNKKKEKKEKIKNKDSKIQTPEKEDKNKEEVKEGDTKEEKSINLEDKDKEKKNQLKEEIKKEETNKEEIKKDEINKKDIKKEGEIKNEIVDKKEEEIKKEEKNDIQREGEKKEENNDKKINGELKLNNGIENNRDINKVKNIVNAIENKINNTKSKII